MTHSAITPSIVAALRAARLDPRSEMLRLDAEGDLCIQYSPFDHVRGGARLAIVGITPGAQQSSNALAAAHAALARGDQIDAALREAKDNASFSGAMRANLVAMLDHVGVARWLGLTSTEVLWRDRLDLVHFTSVLRYPVFVGGKDYGGSSPDMRTSPFLLRHIEAWFGREFEDLGDVLWVPLGDKVAAVLNMLAARHGRERVRILAGLPHPSGANAERVAFFLGRKGRDALSTKTDPSKIDAGRARALATMRALIG